MDTAQRIGAVRYAKESWVQEMTLGGTRSLVLNIPAEYMKDKKPHAVPLTDRCIQSLSYLRMTAIDGFLFPIMGDSTPWNMWDKLRNELKLQGVNLSAVKQHTFRHTAVTRMLQDGQSMARVAKLSKHSIKVMMLRYSHLVIDDTLILIAAMNQRNQLPHTSGEFHVCQ